MQTNEHKVYGTLTVVLAALAGVLLGMLIVPGRHFSLGGKNNQMSKLGEVMELIENYYVDDMGRDSLSEHMITAMLSSLDPHSHYFTKEELKMESESIQGSFEGIGVILFYQGDTAYAQQVMPGGPAEKAGIHPGDRLMYVDTVKISGVGMDKEEVVKHLRGPHHSHADIAVKRYGEKGMRHIKVVRDRISTPSVSYSGMIDKTTGYIHLTRFCETSYDEFCKALTDLKKQGMENLIFDLRGNGGGLLSAAINIADEFLPEKELIVYTKGEHQARENVNSQRGGRFAYGKLAIMIDEYSASASEIVAGCVQDNDRGIIIGRRSFGKGLVQRQFELNDGSAIWLTVARYYTPSGRCIQRPYDKGTDEYYTDFLQQIMTESLSDSLLMKITDSTPYHTKKGRVVYGGGGIYPDFPIKLHGDSLVVYYNRMIGENLFNQFAFDYVTRNLAQLRKKYPSENAFVSQFHVSDPMVQYLLRMADKKGLTRDPRSIAKYNTDIRMMIKAAIGESLFRSETYYRIMIAQDNDVRQAAQIIKRH